MKLQKVAFTMYPVKDMQRAGSYCGERLTLGPGSGVPSSPWAGSELRWRLPRHNHRVRKPTDCQCRRHDCLRSGRPARHDRRSKGKGVSFAADNIAGPVCCMPIVKDPDGNAIIMHKLKTGDERAG